MLRVLVSGRFFFAYYRIHYDPHSFGIPRFRQRIAIPKIGRGAHGLGVPYIYFVVRETTRFDPRPLSHIRGKVDRKKKKIVHVPLPGKYCFPCSASVDKKTRKECFVDVLKLCFLFIGRTYFCNTHSHKFDLLCFPFSDALSNLSTFKPLGWHRFRHERAALALVALLQEPPLSARIGEAIWANNKPLIA